MNDPQMSHAKPLRSKRIVVTRPKKQATEFVALLTALGAEVIGFPTIQIAPAADPAPLDNALAQLVSYDWVIFTSVNGVTAFWERLNLRGASFFGPRVAAIGPATARALQTRGVRPDFVPQEYIAKSIAAGMGDMPNSAILLPQGELADQDLAILLDQGGAQVTEIITYRTLPAKSYSAALSALHRGVDAITFTSSSTVQGFLDLMDREPEMSLENTLVACIGPITAETARDLGLNVGVVASEYTVEGLARAVVEYFAKRKVGAID